MYYLRLHSVADSLYPAAQIPELGHIGRPKPAAREEVLAPEAAKKAEAAVQQQSTSALLQRRSENAVAVREPASPAASEDNIDKHDKLNPRAASEYVADIFDYFRRVEPQYRVSPSYMSRQVPTHSGLQLVCSQCSIIYSMTYKSSFGR